MGFYLRKSVSVGPFRFNLSQSGIGVSTGVKGFRIGTGPRGNYVHMGRGGLYFRSTLPASHKANVSATPQAGAPAVLSGGLREIESGSALAMVDSSSADLLAEINSKAKKVRVWPFALFLALLVPAGLFYAGAPPWVLCPVALLACGGAYFANLQDRLRKTVVVFYEMEPDFEEAYDQVHIAFADMRNCYKRWHVLAEGAVRGLQEWKTHAGADSVVKRTPVTFGEGAPPYFKTNVAIPKIPAGRQTLYLFPDRMLVYASEGVGAVAYDSLEVNTADERLIETTGVPGDAHVVGKTWRYVNKSGGPDRRYKDNCEIPIALYGGLQLSSRSGLREYFQLSRTGVGPKFGAAVSGLARVLSQRAEAASGFVTCACDKCSGHIEVPVAAVGQVVPCPHCGLETTLFSPTISQPPKLPPVLPPATSKTAQTGCEYDPTELLQLCDSILEDGEISGDEAYALSTWLNEHKEACLDWPGDSLVQLLQQIWADGKVTKTELRQLARALVRIRKESVKRKSQQAADEAVTAAKRVFRSFNLAQAAVPLVPFAAEVKSHSERGVRYHVDLSLPSCTCPDFMTRRQSLPPGHINRCCKHIFDAYRQLVSAEDCQGWLRPFVENGWPAHPDSQWRVVPVDGTYVLASTAPNGWSNIYAANGRDFGRYGYNVAEERWAYGEAPRRAEQILGVVRQICGI